MKHMGRVDAPAPMLLHRYTEALVRDRLREGHVTRHMSNVLAWLIREGDVTIVAGVLGGPVEIEFCQRFVSRLDERTQALLMLGGRGAP
jgi:hypothetical protein